MSDDLAFVCDDYDYSGARQSWYFDEHKKMFYRFNKAGNYDVSFDAEHLPDPELLWEDKCKARGALMGDPACKPTAAIFAMWDIIKDTR